MQKSAYLVILLLVCMFIGCVAGTTVGPVQTAPAEVKQTPVLSGRVLIDGDFSGPERVAIARAVEMWVSSLNGALDLQISPNSSDEFSEMQQIIMLQRAAVMANMVAAGKEPVDPVLDEDNPAKLLEIAQSQDFWTGKYCSNRIVVIRANSDTQRVKEAEEHGIALAGWSYTGCWRKFILIVGGRMDSLQNLTTTVAHELGHEFGLFHQFDGSASLMHNDQKSAKCVMKSDLTAFCKRWKCDISKVRVLECNK